MLEIEGRVSMNMKICRYALPIMAFCALGHNPEIRIHEPTKNDSFPWLANASDITAVQALHIKWNWNHFQLDCLHKLNMFCKVKYVCT